MKNMDKKNIQILTNFYKSGDLFNLEIKAKLLLKVYPNELILYNMLGISLAGQKKFIEAVKIFRKAIKIKPNYAEMYCNIGNVFHAMKRYEESIINYKKALKLNSNYSEVYYNMANTQKDQEKFNKAAVNYNKAIKIKPDYAEAYCNLGNVKKRQGKLDEAHNNYQEALKINPKYKEAYINLSYLNLSRENFIDGWNGHEKRNEIVVLFNHLKLNKKKLWTGNKFNGKLLVIGEQGLGDHILFGSMLKDLLKIHKNITVMVEERLFSLFKRSFPKIYFIGHKANIKKTSYKKYIFLGSLGKFFRKSSESFPKNQGSYIIPDKSRIKEIRSLTNSASKIKIGLSWQTNSQNNKEERSIPLVNFKLILKINDFDFFDLQYGNTNNERSLIHKEFGGKLIHFNSLDYTNDIEGLAALVSECDLIITIANFTTQLAGALDIPTWVLLPHTCHWRWFTKRSNSLWYPSIRLFRQSKRGDWESVIRNVFVNLKEMKKKNKKEYYKP